MVYVPLKLIEAKSFIPLSFHLKRTAHQKVFITSASELQDIKSDINSLEIFFEH